MTPGFVGDVSGQVVEGKGPSYIVKGMVPHAWNEVKTREKCRKKTLAGVE